MVVVVSRREVYDYMDTLLRNQYRLIFLLQSLKGHVQRGVPVDEQILSTLRPSAAWRCTSPPTPRTHSQPPFLPSDHLQDGERKGWETKSGDTAGIMHGCPVYCCQNFLHHPGYDIQQVFFGKWTPSASPRTYLGVRAVKKPITSDQKTGSIPV
jgi:hypothetical protein